jgi:hypothetical protein
MTLDVKDFAKLKNVGLIFTLDYPSISEQLKNKEIDLNESELNFLKDTIMIDKKVLNLYIKRANIPLNPKYSFLNDFKKTLDEFENQLKELNGEKSA